jgi:hypothetical protein
LLELPDPLDVVIGVDELVATVAVLRAASAGS